MKTSISLSLVSHTNVGKTTLARTLTRQDVGTVFDQAHVTEVSESWPLVETETARLLLWDTPGFGDTTRLLRRLRNEGNPLGWFLHQVWDRVGDRPLWCSQEAVRNIRQDADVVVYLVSAAEDPLDAAYVSLELELLGWLEKPVLLLLNQTGPPEDAEELEERWRSAVSGHRHVRAVLSLDAFTRCWVQESLLLERVAELLPGDKREFMADLVEAWNSRNMATFRGASAALSALLLETTLDREALPSVMASKTEKSRATAALATRLESRQAAFMARLISDHGLDGAAASGLHESLDDFVLPSSSPVSARGGALLGGLLSGAATGVAADLMVGGLSFGSGMIVGAALGALGGAGLAKGYEMASGVGRRPEVRWGAGFLTELTRQCALRYLAVAQFGRGRGAFHDQVLEEGEGWRFEVEQALGASAETLNALWTRGAVPTASNPGGSNPSADLDTEALGTELTHAVDKLLSDVLVARYPEAAHILE